MGSHVYREALSEMFADRLELDSLVGVQNQKSILDQTQANWRAGIATIKSDIDAMSPTTTFASSPSPAASSNGTGETSAEDATGGAIINRSPTTNYHYYQQPSSVAPATPVPTPAVPGKTGLSPWWLVIPAALMLGGLAWYFWPKPTPQQPQRPESDYRISVGPW